ncbi:MAG: hypothetical protein J7621_05355, partial [Niastella sp.]|nr:hypothetical protein [Niastella sp.]
GNEYRYRRDEKKKVDSISADSNKIKATASNTEADGEDDSSTGSSRSALAELSGPVGVLARLF